MAKKAQESPEVRALHAEMEDLAESRRSLAGLARLGDSWALGQMDQLDARLVECQSRVTTLTLEGRK